MSNIAKLFRDRVQQTHPGAVVVERGRLYLRHYHASSNTYILDTSLGAVHFGPQADQEIDTAWSPSAAPWNYEMVRADFYVHALANFSSGQVVRYTHPATGETITFQPQQLQFRNDLNQIQALGDVQSVMGLANDDELRWNGAFGPDLDFIWNVQTERLAKYLIINNLASIGSPNSTIIAGGNPVLVLQFIINFSSNVDIYVEGARWNRQPNSSVTTTSVVEFRHNVTGETLWWFGIPNVHDQNGSIQVTTHFRRTGSNLFVGVQVPWEWLQSAVYPVVIDPTIDLVVDASADDADETAGGGSFSSTDTDLFMSSSTSATFRYNAGMRFVTSIPQGAPINVGYITFRCTTTSVDDPNVDFYCEDVDNSANFSITPDVTDRVVTTASVSYTATSIGTGDVNSPSLVGPIQEVVDRPGFGGTITVIGKGKSDTSSSFVIRSRDGSSTTCPRLHVEYTASIDVTPVAASAVSSVTGPTVQLGSLSISPLAVTSIAIRVNPTVQLSSVSVTSQSASSIATVVVPTVILGYINITPSQAQAGIIIQEPIVILGSVSVTPIFVSVIAMGIDPTIEIGGGGEVVSPNPAISGGSTLLGAVVLGSILVTPYVSIAIASALVTEIRQGSLSVSPLYASAIASSIGPTVAEDALSITPDPVTMWTETVGGIVSLEEIQVAPTPVQASSVCIVRSVEIWDVGDVVFSDPAHVFLGTLVGEIDIKGGLITIMPDRVVLVGDTAIFAVEQSSVAFTPPASTAALGVRLSISMGGVSFTPSMTTSGGSVMGPSLTFSSVSCNPTKATVKTVTDGRGCLCRL